MVLSKSLQKVAEKVVNKFGGDAIIRTVTSGAYDPVTGTASESVSDVELKGVLEDVNAREVNDLVQAGDRRLLIAAEDVASTPTTADKVVISSVVHQVIRVRTIEQDNEPITYELILRN